MTTITTSSKRPASRIGSATYGTGTRSEPPDRDRSVGRKVQTLRVMVAAVMIIAINGSRGRAQTVARNTYVSVGARYWATTASRSRPAPHHRNTGRRNRASTCRCAGRRHCSLIRRGEHRSRRAISACCFECGPPAVDDANWNLRPLLLGLSPSWQAGTGIGMARVHPRSWMSRLQLSQRVRPLRFFPHRSE